jgi:hypothetical protein
LEQYKAGRILFKGLAFFVLILQHEEHAGKVCGLTDKIQNKDKCKKSNTLDKKETKMKGLYFGEWIDVQKVDAEWLKEPCYFNTKEGVIPRELLDDIIGEECS